MLILAWRGFWRNGFDFVGVDSEFGESFVSCLAMGFGRLGIAASVVGLPVDFVLIELVAAAWRKADRLPRRHWPLGGLVPSSAARR